jgi:hypothetical protein
VDIARAAHRPGDVILLNGDHRHARHRHHAGREGLAFETDHAKRQRPAAHRLVQRC